MKRRRAAGWKTGAFRIGESYEEEYIQNGGNA